MEWADTLAYYNMATITVVKSFIEHAPGAYPYPQLDLCLAGKKFTNALAYHSKVFKALSKGIFSSSRGLYHKNFYGCY
jgi:hypothetical protein